MVDGEIIARTIFENGWISILIFIALWEVVFFIISIGSKKAKDASWVNYNLSNKFLALVLVLLGFVVVYLGLLILEEIIFIIVVEGIIIMFFMINHFIGKSLSKEESEEEYRERTKEEDSKFRFKIGEIVKIKDLDGCDECSVKIVGKEARITKREEDDDYENQYDIEMVDGKLRKYYCDNHYFGESELSKIRTNRKKRGRGPGRPRKRGSPKKR